MPQKAKYEVMEKKNYPKTLLLLALLFLGSTLFTTSCGSDEPNMLVGYYMDIQSEIAYKASEDDESFILSHSDRLVHFHIHDVTKTSNHVALGDGVLDIDRYLEMVKRFGCPMVIEVKEKNDLLKSIDYVKSRLG